MIENKHRIYWQIEGRIYSHLHRARANVQYAKFVLANHYCAATKVLTMRVVTDKRWTHANTERDKTSEQGVQPTPPNPFPIESSRSHIHGVAE